MQDIDIKHMHVFIAVAEAGGLSAAQNRLGLTCPAISKYLADLEVRVGHTLCERGRSGFRLTAAGQEYLSLAKNLQLTLQEHQQTVKKALGLTDKQILRLGCVDHLVSDNSNKFLSSMRRLLDNRPDLTVVPQIIGSNEIIDQLLSNKLDLALSFHTGKVKEIHAQFLHNEHIVAIAATNHPIWQRAKGKKVTIADIARFEVAAFKPGLITNFEGERVVENIEEILWLVHLSNCLGIVPMHVARAHEREKQVGILNIQDWEIESSIYLLCHASKWRQPMYQSLFQDVQMQLSQNEP
ncbi:MAG: LysR family transcriptional regulator [Alteromonadaceae bacterium]|nr:LysR family transcriptional regulator [Alteromonadaceae bacterium]